jgi:hypothetical protein
MGARSGCAEDRDNRCRCGVRHGGRWRDENNVRRDRSCARCAAERTMLKVVMRACVMMQMPWHGAEARRTDLECKCARGGHEPDRNVGARQEHQQQRAG